MSRVTYQVPMDGPHPAPAPPPAFRPVDADAIVTRRKDAKATVSVGVSRAQARWLRRFDQPGRPGGDAVIRALVDLAMDLEVDWARVDGASALRAEIRDAVLVRLRD